jgi:hypothetical protein
VLRGYSWMTVCASELVDRLGGVGALVESGAFWKVRVFDSGAVWLQATDHLNDYNSTAMERVFTVLAPVLPTRDQADLGKRIPALGAGRRVAISVTRCSSAGGAAYNNAIDEHLGDVRAAAGGPAAIRTGWGSSASRCDAPTRTGDETLRWWMVNEPDLELLITCAPQGNVR